MWLIEKKKRTGVKIRIDGPDKDGKNTCRAMLVGDTDVEEIAELIKAAIKHRTREELAGGA